MVRAALSAFFAFRLYAAWAFGLTGTNMFPLGTLLPGHAVGHRSREPFQLFIHERLIR